MSRAIILALALVVASTAAQAQLRKPQITGHVIDDTEVNLGIKKPGELALTGDPVADLHTAIIKGGAKLIAHLKQQYALAVSLGADGAQVDPIAAPCAKALVPVVDLVINGPKAAALPAGDPMAMTAEETAIVGNTSEPDSVIVKIEKIRIMRRAIQGDALNTACGPLVQDEVKQAKNLAGGIASLITGAGVLAPIGL